MAPRVRFASVAALAAAVALGTASLTFGQQPQGQPAPTPAPAAQPNQGQHQHKEPQYTGPFPPIRVTPINVDFGTANPDHPIHTSVKITNSSPKAIRIREVRPTCKCTVPTLPKDVLAAGETIEVPLVIDLRGSIGAVRKPFHIFVEGWNRPVEAVVMGKLSYAIEVTPDSPPAVPARKGEIVMKSVDGRPFKVIAVHGRAPQVVERKPATGERALEWTIQWDLGHLNFWPYMMVVETDHPECEVLTLRMGGPAIGNVEFPYIKNWPVIFVNRTNVNLGAIPAGGSVEIDVPVTRPDRAKPCEISFAEDTVVDTLDGLVKAEVVRVEPVDGRPDDELYFVRVTNISEKPQIVCAPLFFRTTTDEGVKQARCWIGGVLRAGDGVAAANRAN